MTRTLSLAVSFSGSLADPFGSSPLVAAVQWLQHTLLGTIATTVAVIAVAWVGVMMLSGRVTCDTASLSFSAASCSSAR